uniref:Goadsporin biosynthetic protein n=1 Tax=Streptomyces sp. TP-A0584 TaxID=314563 RepID=Q3C2F4_9ACTN
MRFIDEFGMHLRLRVRVPAPRASAIGRLVETRIRMFLGAVVKDTAAPFAGHLGLSRSLYAPEVLKYGGYAGTQHAEKLFQLSSETALTLMPYAVSRRLQLARTHLEALTASLPTSQRVSFLHQYAWYWSHGPHGRTPGYAARLDTLLRAQPDTRIAHLDAVHVALDTYARQCRALIDQATAARLRTSRTYLLFQHIHLMHNRLGVTPLEEALTARALWHATYDPKKDSQ